MSYQAIFFDGKSSTSHSVTICPNASNWKISFDDKSIVQSDILWSINEIKKSEAYTKGFITFTYGSTFPFQKIESTDTEFINYIHTQNNNKLNNKVDILLHKSAKKSIAVSLLFIIGFASLMYFFVIPTVAVAFAKNLHKNHVIKFGDYVYNILSHELDIDTRKSEKLQDFVNTLHIECEFPIHIQVAKSDELNAFAVSGGKIIIYSALLNKIENQHQLAALIGHEVSHIQNRHMLKSITRSFSGAIFISVLFGDINSVTTILGENAHLFYQLSFSRNLEKEADIFGMNLLENNQLNAHGMPELFELLEKETSIEIPEYLSKHPMLKERIEYSKKIADEQTYFTENSTLKQKWIALKNCIHQEIIK